MTTTQCYDPVAAPDACAPPDLPPNQQGQKACSSSAQCGADEFCEPANGALCLGPGYCISKTNCGTSSGSSVCGCDGVTYTDIQTACLHGVHVIGIGACGDAQGAGGSNPGKEIVHCASDDVCPGGEACCYITGQCYDASKPALCAFPPPGTSFPCLENGDCPGASYCSAEGCDGPGGCVNVPGDCPGTLSPVCGCDGKTYVNADCAAEGATRVAHDGECAP